MRLAPSIARTAIKTLRHIPAISASRFDEGAYPIGRLRAPRSRRQLPSVEPGRSRSARRGDCQSSPHPGTNTGRSYPRRLVAVFRCGALHAAAVLAWIRALSAAARISSPLSSSHLVEGLRVKPLAKPDLHGRVSSWSAVSADRRNPTSSPRHRGWHPRDGSSAVVSSRGRSAFTRTGRRRDGSPTSTVGGHAAGPHEKGRREAWSERGQVDPIRSASLISDLRDEWHPRAARPIGVTPRIHDTTMGELDTFVSKWEHRGRENSHEQRKSTT